MAAKKHVQYSNLIVIALKLQKAMNIYGNQWKMAFRETTDPNIWCS